MSERGGRFFAQFAKGDRREVVGAESVGVELDKDGSSVDLGINRGAVTLCGDGPLTLKPFISNVVEVVPCSRRASESQIRGTVGWEHYDHKEAINAVDRLRKVASRLRCGTTAVEREAISIDMRADLDLIRRAL